MTATGVVATVAGLLVVSSAVAFARSDQALRVASDALIVRNAEQARSATATYRAAMTIAVVAAASEPRSEVSRRAADAASRALDRVTTAQEAIDEPVVADLIDRVSAIHPSVVDALQVGDFETADLSVTAEILPILGDLEDRLTTQSATASARIEAEGAAAGSATRISSFLVALVAPALGLWAVRRSNRRRQERERLANELDRQRALAQMQEDLIAGLSHQLRTPLTGIYGFAEALLDDSTGSELDVLLVVEASQTILGEANRLRGMVDDILVTARSQSGPLAFDESPFDLASELTAAIEPFQRTGAAIEVSCDPATIIGDRLRLRHVIRNLVDNALRHGGGPVRVIGSMGAGYVLAVEDSGDGPAAGTALFRPFTHSAEDVTVTGSLGLGLSVCRAICDGMAVRLAHERIDDVTRFVLTWESAAVAAVPLAGRSRAGAPI